MQEIPNENHDQTELQFDYIYEKPIRILMVAVALPEFYQPYRKVI